MASEQAPARRPTSHRRTAPPPQRHFPLRSSAALALVTGLAITTPLILRVQKHEIALGPERAFPDTVTDSSGGADSTVTDPTVTDPAVVDPASSPAAPPASSLPAASLPASSLPASAAASAGDRTADQVSRNAARAPSVAALGPDRAAAFEDQVVALTNAQRAAHGCPALRSDHRLQLAALGHSVDMQARDYFEHDSPDGSTPWTRIEAQGYTAPSAENIAKGQATPQAVVDAWMASPGHRANILNCSAKAVGVGVQFGADGPWWTQDFGSS